MTSLRSYMAWTTNSDSNAPKNRADVSMSSHLPGLLFITGITRVNQPPPTPGENA